MTIRTGWEIHSSLLVDGESLLQSTVETQEILNNLCVNFQIRTSQVLPQDGKLPYFWDQDKNKDTKHTHPVSRHYVKFVFIAYNLYYLLITTL